MIDFGRKAEYTTGKEIENRKLSDHHVDIDILLPKEDDRK